MDANTCTPLSCTTTVGTFNGNDPSNHLTRDEINTQTTIIVVEYNRCINDPRSPSINISKVWPKSNRTKPFATTSEVWSSAVNLIHKKKLNTTKKIIVVWNGNYKLNIKSLVCRLRVHYRSLASNENACGASNEAVHDLQRRTKCEVLV